MWQCAICKETNRSKHDFNHCNALRSKKEKEDKQKQFKLFLKLTKK